MTFFANYEEAMAATPEEMEAMNRYVDHFEALIAKAKVKGEPLSWGILQYREEIAAFKATLPKTRWQKFCAWLNK
jgi:hypothetical protein